MADETQEQNPTYRIVKIKEENRSLKIPVPTKCFYCGDEINQDDAFLRAQTTYQLKGRGTRYEDRTFHLPCYHELLARIGEQERSCTGWHLDVAISTLECTQYRRPAEHGGLDAKCEYNLQLELQSWANIRISFNSDGWPTI